jgi:hypothetical protein
MPDDTSKPSAKTSFLARMKKEMAYAFAVEKGTEDELTPENRETLDKLADRVVKMQMAVPAIMFLESIRPLNFIGSQALLFFKPLLGIAVEGVNLATTPLLGFSVDVTFYNRVQEVMEKRASVEALIVRIERRLQDAPPATPGDATEDTAK